MRYGWIFLLVLVFVISGCSKEIPVDLTDYDQKRLVVEGKITDAYETQKFSITWTSNLGADHIETAEDVYLTVTTPTGLINYYPVGEGIYESEVPFAGIPGEYYTISFYRDGTAHSVTTQMPGALTIENFSMVTTNGIPFYTVPSIYLTMTSDQKQYFRYDVFKLDNVSGPAPMWVNTQVPVYEVRALEPGQQQVVLNQLNTSLYSFDSSDVAQVIIYSLSNDVGQYLDQLRNFMTAEPKGGKYENPPFYYSNEAYGLGYGTSIDTLYYFF